MQNLTMKSVALLVCVLFACVSANVIPEIHVTTIQKVPDVLVGTQIQQQPIQPAVLTQLPHLPKHPHIKLPKVPTKQELETIAQVLEAGKLPKVVAPIVPKTMTPEMMPKATEQQQQQKQVLTQLPNLPAVPHIKLPNIPTPQELMIIAEILEHGKLPKKPSGHKITAHTHTQLPHLPAHPHITLPNVPTKQELETIAEVLEVGKLPVVPVVPIAGVPI